MKNKVLLFVISLLIQLSCKNSTTIVLSISEIPTNVKMINASVTIDGNVINIAESFAVKNNDGSLLASIEIPWKYENKQVKVNLSASDGKCTLAKWSGTVATLNPEVYSVSSVLEREISDPNQGDFFTVHYISPDDAWAAGSAGTLMHWDGCYWRNVDVVSAKTRAGSINKIYHHGDIGTWAVGDNGVIARRDEVDNNFKILDKVRALYESKTGFNGNYPIWLDIEYINMGSVKPYLMVVGILPLATVGAEPLQILMKLEVPPSGASQINDYVVSSDIYNQLRFDDIACNVCADVEDQSCADLVSRCQFYPVSVKLIDGVIYLGGTAKKLLVTEPLRAAYGKMSADLRALPFGNGSRLSPLQAFSLKPRPTAQVPMPIEPGGSPVAVVGGLSNAVWLRGKKLYKVSDNRFELYPGVYHQGSVDYRITSSAIVGKPGTEELLLVASPDTRFSQVLKIPTRSDPASVVSKAFLAAIPNYALTAISGVKLEDGQIDAWLVGYAGIRLRWNGTTVVVHR